MTKNILSPLLSDRGISRIFLTLKYVFEKYKDKTFCLKY